MDSPLPYYRWLANEYAKISPRPAPPPLPPPLPFPVPELPVVRVGGLRFSGPVLLVEAPDAFAGWQGVYLVTRRDPDANRTMYVGISGQDIGIRIAWHEWRDRWSCLAHGRPMLAYAHIEPSDGERLKKEAFLRELLDPICGIR